MYRNPLHNIKCKYLICFFVVLLILELLGVYKWIYERNFHTDFHYPYDGDFSYSAYLLRNGFEPQMQPINNYNYPFIYNLTEKCKTDQQIKIVYLIKSSPENHYRRSVIRATWGYEHRFSDVEIRRVFLLGFRENWLLQEKINEEQLKHGDILQSNFTDAYFNNTIKTMMGFKWAATFCDSAKFYMFVDDDYYVSTKNLLRFVRNPTHYPEYVKGSLKITKNNNKQRETRQLIDFDVELHDDVKLYAGYVFNSSPLRHYFTKFQIGLDEYPYNRWPPYVTAGALLLSREALLEMYYASFYTKHFRFDDIYVALLAYRSNIEPFHSDEFHFYKKDYSRDAYTFTVASHGFDDAVELITAWNEQKIAGNA